MTHFLVNLGRSSGGRMALAVVAILGGLGWYGWQGGLTPWQTRSTVGDSSHDDHDHDHGQESGPEENGLLPPPPLSIDDDPSHSGSEGHVHAGHDDATALELSEQARKNIGLRTGVVALTHFTRTIEIPGIVEERPGRSTIEVTAPMTGIMTKIEAIEGEAVEPGQKLFELRMTHEELVQSQAELLQTVEEIDVAKREIARIESVTTTGGVAGKQLLERKYDLQKLEATLRSRTQALRLHGLSEEQVNSIVQDRELLKDMTVVAPQPSEPAAAGVPPVVFQVQGLRAAQGRHVAAGESLAILTEHSSLFVRGEAFESDVAAISAAADQQLPVTGLLDVASGTRETITNLRILYLAGSFSPLSRTLDFFVTLPNTRLRDARIENGHRFISWRFRPGQRMQLLIPVETWSDRLVLPIEAVAQEGAETFVFVANGDHFDRRGVHVEYRDSQTVVIANDGAVKPGETVALNSAQQLQLALKNRSGAGLDPHAGHNH